MFLDRCELIFVNLHLFTNEMRNGQTLTNSDFKILSRLTAIGSIAATTVIFVNKSERNILGNLYLKVKKLLPLTRNAKMIFKLLKLIKTATQQKHLF